MNKLAVFLFIIMVAVLSCEKTPVQPDQQPDPIPPVVDTTKTFWWSIVEYDATLNSHDGLIFYTYTYHVKDTLYCSYGDSHWNTMNYNSRDTFYNKHGNVDPSTLSNKGCIALVSPIDPSQQPNYNYYIGNYYKFAFFNDTTVGNLQFMVPADNFPSIDSIPVGVEFLNFKGGIIHFIEIWQKRKSNQRRFSIL